MPLPTNKIAKIHISNFKFFDKNRVIDLEGKDHLILYGENGSGKSSIYWALYTLLDSSIKDNQGQIEKYFRKGDRDNLVNIYANNNNHSYVKLELDNGTEYQISPTNYDILNNATINGNAQAINLASDFINYRMLYKFHDLKHSYDFEVFNYFLSEILMYLTIPTLSNQRADKVWKELIQGPEKDFDLTGTEVHPMPVDITISNPALAGLQTKYKTYRKKLNTFNRWFKNLLRDVESIANDILENDLAQPFKIKIKFIPKVPDYDRQNPVIYKSKILIDVPTFNGKIGKIKKPHTFLNEARLTALAISIRIGILKSRLTVSPIRLLILDDLLISLDMSNRDAILDVVLKKLSEDYQLLILTHDYNFYEFTKDKINKYNKELSDLGQPQKTWTKLEMYEYKIGTRPVPNIIKSKTALEKANKYFYGKEDIDLAACGNNLRKATEKFCELFLPVAAKYNANYIKLDLAPQIQKIPAEAIAKGLTSTLFADLDSYRQTIFNPQSHYNLSNPPLFKSELGRAIKTLQDISILTNIIL